MLQEHKGISIFIILALIGSGIYVGLGFALSQDIHGEISEMSTDYRYDGDDSIKVYYITIDDRMIEVSYFFVYQNVKVGDIITLNMFWDYGYWVIQS
jgi:hypothetical protein